MSLKIFLPQGTSAWDTIYQTPNGQPVYRAVRAARFGDGKDTLKVFKIDVKAKACLPPRSYPESGSRRSSLFELWQESREIASIRFHVKLQCPVRPDEITMNGVTVREKDMFRTQSSSSIYGGYVVFMYCAVHLDFTD
jgi:hypothetical protein